MCTLELRLCTYACVDAIYACLTLLEFLPRWVERTDPKGKVFYNNTYTAETTTVRPVAPPPPLPTPRESFAVFLAEVRVCSPRSSSFICEFVTESCAFLIADLL